MFALKENYKAQVQRSRHWPVYIGAYLQVRQGPGAFYYFIMSVYLTYLGKRGL